MKKPDIDPPKCEDCGINEVTWQTSSWAYRCKACSHAHNHQPISRAAEKKKNDQLSKEHTT